MGELLEFVAKASGKLGLPQEVLTGLPVLEMTGDAALLIEQHSGICAYSEQSVCIRVNIGHIRIEGSGLFVHTMTRQKMVIYGRIASVHIERRRQ